MVGATRRLIACWLAALALPVAAEDFTTRGTCRDGLPQGVYELRGENGRLRVLGAYNQGRRTGSFLFWTSTGVRIAHLPYSEGALNGTVSLWYADSNGAEPRRKLEAAYVANRREGETRSWHGNGKLRARYIYRAGELRSAEAWDDDGRKLPPGDARDLAARDLAADNDFFNSLDRIVRAHPPDCQGPQAPLQRAA